MKDKWTQGYICAVASLVSSHDPSTEVKELLGSIGPVRRQDIDSVDWARLKAAGWTKGNYVVAEQGKRRKSNK
jgi:hypothetical protein